MREASGADWCVLVSMLVLSLSALVCSWKRLTDTHSDRDLADESQSA